MDGFLDEICGGVTELRVHGVSGTPPEGMLNHPHPHPRMVTGDGTTGFYRRWSTDGRPHGEHADVPGSRHREAYAWGGLTSGGRTIALWLLLLPFALANLSYFMLRRPPRGALRHVTEAAQRLFALLLTGTLVGAVTRASVDLIGWQCTAAGRACTAGTVRLARGMRRRDQGRPQRDRLVEGPARPGRSGGTQNLPAGVEKLLQPRPPSQAPHVQEPLPLPDGR
ncbi:hypothetical protein [Nonomuraea sp. NPDC049695]|uniref:hypothetical protein n=1 Tax=Nonomuraea sp. NPDC049695 TaxID=3154734 RepID=UPI00342AD44C